MGRTKTAVADKVKKAVQMLLVAPALTVPQAMMASGEFSKEESTDRAAQIKIRRYYNEVKSTRKTVPEEVGVTSVSTCPESPLTTTTNGHAAGLSTLPTDAASVSTTTSATCPHTKKKQQEKKLAKVAGVTKNRLSGYEILVELRNGILEELRNKEIMVRDAALGQLETHKRELEAAFTAMSPGSKAETIKMSKELDTHENGEEE